MSKEKLPTHLELFTTVKEQGTEQLELLRRIAASLEGIQAALQVRKSPASNLHSEIASDLGMPRTTQSTPVLCRCGHEAIQFRASDKARKYPGKLFWRCAQSNNCGFVQLV